MIVERHNLSCCLIIKAISGAGSLGSCFVSMENGSKKRLAMQNLQIPDTAETRIRGSFHPLPSWTKSEPAVLSMLFYFLPIRQKQRGYKLLMEGMGYLEWRLPLKETGSFSVADPPSPDSTNLKIFAFFNVTPTLEIKYCEY
jgi:hypothetical protein